MLLLVTGASCVGKTTVRRAISPRLAPAALCVEFCDLVPIPAAPDVAWRQESVEAVVRHALELQAQGRHLLLCGDPVAPGEILAAPSAPELAGIAMCLLDVQPEAQKARLQARHEPPENWVNHLGFAAWMREHARDPQHLPVVIRHNSWDAMQWERWENWQQGDPRWHCAEIDITNLSREAVADATFDWCKSALAGAALTGRWWE